MRSPLWLAAFVAGTALAQVTESDLPMGFDPGLQQERTFRSEEYYQERQREERAPEGPVIEESERPQGGALPEDGTRFRLEGIQFNASAFIDAERLRTMAEDYVGREVDFAAINDLVGRINDLYAERGIVTARALVPPQRIDDGVLRILLVEGRLGELRLEGDPYTRQSYIRNRLPLADGEVIDVPALRDALQYFNRTGNVALRASLAAGANTGESDVLLSVAEPPRIQAQAFIDNNGSESTGETRAGIYSIVNGPFGIDDRLTGYVAGAEGSVNGMLSYELPVNRRGGRLQAYYAQGEIELVEGPFSALDITGDSSEYGLSFNQPVFRRDTLWLDGYLRGAQVASTTDLEGSPLSDYDVLRTAGGAQVTGFGAGYEWTVRQGLTWASVENIFGVEEDFLFLDGDASYLRAFGTRFIGQVRVGWQWSQEETAPSPLLFQVGGVDTVRGYPSGALAGASGYLLSLEGRYRWREQVQPFVFLDHGLVADVSPDQETISSLGLGIRWQFGSHLSGELAWGQTLEDVLPDQDSGRLHARIAYTWPGL